MANMFAELAKRATVLSPVMTDREKVSTEDIIKKYPNGITITEFDIVTTPDKDGNNMTYPVLAFKEDETKFLYGGKALMDIVAVWLSHFEGDIESTSSALKAAGGVKIQLEPARTKSGRNFTRVNIIG